MGIMDDNFLSDFGAKDLGFTNQVYPNQCHSSDALQSLTIDMPGDFELEPCYNKQLPTIWEVPEPDVFAESFMAASQPTNLQAHLGEGCALHPHEMLELRQELLDLRVKNESLERTIATTEQEVWDLRTKTEGLEKSINIKENEFSDQKEKLCEEVDQHVKCLKDWVARLNEAAQYMYLDQS